MSSYSGHSAASHCPDAPRALCGSSPPLPLLSKLSSLHRRGPMGPTSLPPSHLPLPSVPLLMPETAGVPVTTLEAAQTAVSSLLVAAGAGSPTSWRALPEGCEVAAWGRSRLECSYLVSLFILNHWRPLHSLVEKLTLKDAAWPD